MRVDIYVRIKWPESQHLIVPSPNAVRIAMKCPPEEMEVGAPTHYGGFTAIVRDLALAGF